MTIQDLIDYANKHNLPLTTYIGNCDHFGNIISPYEITIYKKWNDSIPFINLNITDKGEEPD